MAFISPEYLELNKQLHADEKTYGTGSFRWAQEVMDLKDATNSETVLDYGAGKGTLKSAMGSPDWLTEFDPAVPGKDTPPRPADLVVCTDVLEHIEPDQLEHVLHHLWRLAKRAVFISVALVPSSKTLADGRNAHLIQEGRAWWKQRLGRYFRFTEWRDEGGQIICAGQKIYQLGDIKVISAVSEDMRLKQATDNSAKAKRRLDWQKPHQGRATIVCFGPSLAEPGMIDDIKNDRIGGAVIVSVSGAHDYLIGHGVVPDVHIDIDPRPHKAHFTKNAHPKVRYWMASCVHPSVVDNLLGYDLTLFHIYNSETDKKISEFEPDSWGLGGGGSVGCRAINLLYTQGYRIFDVYGMDCSFTKDGEQHAGFHSGKRQQVWDCRVGKQWFKTSGAWVATAKSVIENMQVLDKAAQENGDPKLDGDSCIISRFHGDGLLPNLIRVATPEMEIDLVRDPADYKDPNAEPDPVPEPGESISSAA